MYHITCGRLITGTGEVIEGAFVTVGDDGRIDAVGRGSPPAGAHVDWSAFTVVPGFVDAHDHLSIDMGDEEAQARESVVTHVLRSVRNARSILASGITTLRDVGARGYIDVDLRDAIARGEIVGPRLVVSGQFVTRTGGHGWYFSDEADGPDGVRKAVRQQAKRGADLIKIMASGGIGTPNSVPTLPGYSKAEVEAAVEEAHALGLKIAAHIHGGPAARWAVEAGLDSIEHGVFLDRPTLELMAERGTFLVLTWGVIANAAVSDDVPDYFKRKAGHAMESYGTVLAQAIELGVKIAVGGDTYHARIVEELAALVEAGMDRHEALIAGSRNGAELCGVLDVTGTIEGGKWADLVALDGNPLDDIAAVARVMGVMKEGRAVDLSAA